MYPQPGRPPGKALEGNIGQTAAQFRGQPNLLQGTPLGSIINPGAYVDAFVKDINALINSDVKMAGDWLSQNLPLAIIAVLLIAVMLLAASSFIKD